MNDLSILGNKVAHAIEADALETFEAPAGISCVELTSDEFTSLCPVTGQPDFQSVVVQYHPSQRCLESKSFKLYLWGYRNKGIFCESLAAQIAHDLQSVLEALWLSVTISQKARGGICIQAKAVLTNE